MPVETAPPTIRKIHAFLEKWPGSEYGPAHIVLSDHNLDDDFIHFCLKEIETNLSNYAFNGDHSEEEITATKAFLLELLAIPEEARFEGMEDW